MSSGLNILDKVHPVFGLDNTVPSGSTPTRVNLKYARSVGVLIRAVNTNGVTGSAITLLQAKDLTNSDSAEKALAFTTYFANTDTGAADAPWTKVSATNSTFTTSTTNTKSLAYFIPVDPATLDQNNGFKYLRVGTANAVNSTFSVTYLLAPKYAGNPEDLNANS